MGTGIIGLLYHSWGNHVNNFFGKSCFLKIKSVKEYTLFKREVKCKLRELTTQVRLSRSEESHRGSYSKTLWRERQHTKLSTCLPLPLLNKRLERGSGICPRLPEQEEAQAFPTLPHLGPKP